jgi:localization factor PodJL
MKSGIPWSVKGIEPGAREAAKDAARRSGLTLGEWLNTIILEQVDEAGAARPQPSPAPPKERFASIAEELALMGAQRPQPASSRHFDFVPPQQNAIDFDSVIDRIQNNERYLAEALGSINERIAAITTQLGKQMEPAQIHPDTTADYEALATALRNIIGHLEISERRTHDALTSVQERLQSLDAATQTEAGDHAARLQNLENVVAEFTERVGRQLGEQTLETSHALHSELVQIAERVEALQASSNNLRDEAKSAALEAVKAEIGEIERHMQSLASHAQSGLKQSTESRGDIARLQTDLARLKADIGQVNQRIDEIKGEAATQHDIQFLRKLVEELSAHVARLPAGDIEQRLSDTARRISDIEIRGRALPQIDEVAQRIQELEERLVQERPGAGLQQELDELRELILRTNDRLAGTEDRLSSVGTIERSVSQLFQALEDNREDVPEIAEEAARRVVQELLREQSQIAANAPGDVQALEEALGALRQQCTEMDQQTEETFGALHDTMEEIINKLTSLEAGQHASVEAAGASAGSAAQPPPPVAARSGEPLIMEAAPQAWQTAVQEHLAKVQVDLEDDDPRREPGLQPELAASPEDPAGDLFVEAEEAHSEHTPYAAASARFSPEDDDDFIAAARRAAQAAAQGSRLGIGRLPFSGSQSEGRKAPVKGGFTKFSFSLFRRPPALKPRHPRGVAEDIAAAADSTTLPPETGRRRLLLAALLLLAAVSAYALRGQKETPPPRELPRSETQQPAFAVAPEKSSLLQPERGFGQPLALAAAIGSPGLRAAAENGQPEAQFVIAGRYSDGSHVGQNHTEAAKWYHRAARQGLAPAQFRLAAHFERGTGVEKDLAKARFWYRAAAAQGNVKAMHNLAVLLMDPEKPDHMGAAQWFAEAAGYGLRDSQYNIGLLYERGLGVEENAAEACFWFLAAAAQGDPDALAKARAIENSLPTALQKAARDRLQKWKAKNLERDANVVSLALAQS